MWWMPELATSTVPVLRCTATLATTTTTTTTTAAAAIGAVSVDAKPPATSVRRHGEPTFGATARVRVSGPHQWSVIRSNRSSTVRP